MLTVGQAFKILKEEGLTTNINIVRRWIRAGKLKAEPYESRIEGYRIKEEDLQDFIISKKGISEFKVNEIKKWYVENNSFIVDEKAKNDLVKILE